MNREDNAKAPEHNLKRLKHKSAFLLHMISIVCNREEGRVLEIPTTHSLRRYEYRFFNLLLFSSGLPFHLFQLGERYDRHTYFSDIYLILEPCF